MNVVFFDRIFRFNAEQDKTFMDGIFQNVIGKHRNICNNTWNQCLLIK